MLENFDPKEKKVIIIFIALLFLGLVYVSTHDLNLSPPNENELNPVTVPDATSSGRYL